MYLPLSEEVMASLFHCFTEKVIAVNNETMKP